MNKGFTLIELSISLLIIGLLVGGVLVGQNLIRSAELQSVHKDFTQFNVASNSFLVKYSTHPGDFRNAQTLWGAGVANGNGNRKIDYSGGGLGEEYNAWAHLSQAGLTKGTYTGSDVTSLPNGSLGNSHFRLSYQTGVYGKNGHMLSVNAKTGPVANAAILSPNDVYSLDSKLDDGYADSGKLMGFNEEGVPGCVTNDYTVGSGDYVVGSDEIKCKIFYVVE
jgi:prepilin-type N-terminal cleavage/methylation domain-containing protein